MKRLKELLANIPNYILKGNSNITITGITSNSKQVERGNLFIAKSGRTFNGADYIPEAIALGANAILMDHINPDLKDIVQVIHPNIQSIEGSLAANFFQNPSHELLMVGITGTKGKTTTSFIIKNLLDRFYGDCGLIGTIENKIANKSYRSVLTTPDVISNHKILREICLNEGRAAVMEVTSHALHQNRVAHIDFDIAIFTHLTSDHLDYHGSIENYLIAKNKLFRSLGNEKTKKKQPKWAIVNQDSPWSTAMLEGCSCNVMTYGLTTKADLHVVRFSLDDKGTAAEVSFKGKKIDCYWPLVGRFNIYNCLGAMGVLLLMGIPLETVAEGMAQIPAVRGRLQPVINDLRLKIYVDFAHTEDALLNVLKTLKEISQTKGRLIVVFGCGGDRDRSKRPKMGKVCETYADFSIITSDNPRSENPIRICEEIMMGFKNSSVYHVEVDRKTAIRKAISMACEDDVILIAGRGHETEQIFAHQTIPFSDSEIALEICTQLRNEL